MTFAEKVNADLDYFNDISDAQEIVDCKDALVGDILLNKRLGFGKGADKYMGPVTDIERYAAKRLREMYNYEED